MTDADNLARARGWIESIRYDGRPCACRLQGMGLSLGQTVCLPCASDALTAAVRAKGEVNAVDLSDGVKLLKSWPISDQPTAVEALEDAAANVRAHAADIPPVPS